MHPPFQPGISGNLSVNPNARFSSNEMYSPQVVCFCDIPVEDLNIHVQKYGPFGIAFPKAILVERGANPVFYVANPSKIHNRFSSDFIAAIMRDPTKIDYDRVRASVDQKMERGAAFDRAVPEWHRLVEMLRDLLMRTNPSPGVHPEAHKLHDLTLFMEFEVFSLIKCFDPNLDESHHENFYMEREWRVVGNVPFTLADLSRVHVPEEFGHRLRADVPDYAGQVHFLADES